MNSKTGFNKVGIKKSHRESLKRNLVNDLIIYEYLTTTAAKSKLVLANFDRIIGIANGDKTDHEKVRTLEQFLHNDTAVAKIMEVFTKRFASEKSGLVRVYKVGNRKGDNADMVKLMVKGYVYKEVGKKVAAKPVKKAGKVEAKTENKLAAGVQTPKNVSAKSQVAGSAAAAKVKTRSGI